MKGGGKTVVFVHGMFMTSLCWEGWIPLFEKAGHKVVAKFETTSHFDFVSQVVAPNWPLRDAPVAAQKDDATNKEYLAKLGKETRSCFCFFPFFFFQGWVSWDCKTWWTIS